MSIVTERYISDTETAKIVRHVLRDKFPGLKFSVRVSRYSMGSSIHVSFTGGTRKTRFEVSGAVQEFCGTSLSECGDFSDPCTRQWNGETVRFGNRHISVSQSGAVDPTLALDTIQYCEHGIPDFATCPACGR